MVEGTTEPVMGALPPPPGIIPHHVDTPSFHKGQIVVLFVTVIVSTLCIAARISIRLVNRFANARWDDYMSFFAWLTMIVHVALCFECSKHGSGMHMWDVSMSEVVHIAKFATINEIFYSLPIYLTKLSILLQYLRIFVVSRTGVTFYTIQGLIWLNLAYYIAITFALIFACVPKLKASNPAILSSYAGQQNILMGTTVVNIVTNILILILPLNCLRKLQMSLQHKLGISLIFATGIFAVFTSAMWLVRSVHFANNPDLSYNLAVVAAWMNAELAAGIIIGCMPTFPQFCKQTIPKASANLRGYWTRARTSLLSSKSFHPTPVAELSWDSRNQIQQYLKVDERGGQNIEMTAETKRQAGLAWNGAWIGGKGNEGDVEKGSLGEHEHVGSGI